jgi:hypothetical protein
MRRRPPSLLRSLASCAALAALALSPASCLSPTLPLPPPTIDSASEAATAGAWALAGTCEAGAFVQILDQNTAPERGAVVQCSNEGVYQLTVQAKLCDLLIAQQTLGESASPDTSFVLQAFEDGMPVTPNACP